MNLHSRIARLRSCFKASDHVREQGVPREIEHSAWRIGQSVFNKRGVQFLTLCALRLALCELEYVSISICGKTQLPDIRWGFETTSNVIPQSPLSHPAAAV